VLNIFGRPGERMLVRASGEDGAGYGDPHADARTDPHQV
jgi:hypothetical protein